MRDDIYFDDQGRFQMAKEELDDFVKFLRENKIGCEIEPAERHFHSGGMVFAFAKIQHPFDADNTQKLYHFWRDLREGPSPG